MILAQRTYCLCDGEYIGIETIYTVRDGKQINIPEKLKELREKARKNQLFCPCGCGSNLTVVAGDRNLREQHFRLKGDYNPECRAVIEGKCSIDSKIVLKCWLDDKLNGSNIESRVEIQDVDDINRKYEFTFLSRERKIAVSYYCERVNLSDEKLDILESNSKGIKIVYVVDCRNAGFSGQYPEYMMKVQNRQEYCLYMYVADSDYYNAKMKAVYYVQNLDGLWQEVVFAEGYICEYDIGGSGNLLYKGISLIELLKASKENFKIQFTKDQEQREHARKRWEEEQKRLFEEAEKRKKKIREQQEELDRKRQLFIEEEKNRKAEADEEQRVKEEQWKAEQERIKTLNFYEEDDQIIDSHDKIWLECEFCGKKARDTYFTKYKNPLYINLGICSECSKNNVEAKKKIMQMKQNLNKCPQCGGKLVERRGYFGSFWGCSNYPECRYTKPSKV